ncbi:MAG: YicC family protein [Ignavibacteria bacterium]|mgnify:CR=1 FL=1|nr:YicC family protein [Ignavibacteria bacterium]HCN36242.1 YicC family protein [Bacteroidota bacterium]
MILSMTGYGKAEGKFQTSVYSVEIRSVNNRFLEISFKYPKYLSSKDFELKEIIKKKISRGKLNINLTISAESDADPHLKMNAESINNYFRFLKNLKKTLGLKDKIKLEHILHFTDLMGIEEEYKMEEEEFEFIKNLMNKALDDILKMKSKEGEYLKNDMFKRLDYLSDESIKISSLSKKNIDDEKEKLLKKVLTLMNDSALINEKRLEMEITLLADKLDITEECTRLDSHIKYFKEYSSSDELAGRRLNFLLQEMNREINTMGSKSLDADISQKIAVMKEELEKIREQIQNVE